MHAASQPKVEALQIRALEAGSLGAWAYCIAGSLHWKLIEPETIQRRLMPAASLMQGATRAH